MGRKESNQTNKSTRQMNSNTHQYAATLQVVYVSISYIEDIQMFLLDMSFSHWYPGSGVVLDCFDS